MYAYACARNVYGKRICTAVRTSACRQVVCIVCVRLWCLSDLLKLRKDLAAYQGALQRAGVPDHDVWMLKQSTAGASLIFSEKLIAFLYATALVRTTFSLLSLSLVRLLWHQLSSSKSPSRNSSFLASPRLSFEIPLVPWPRLPAFFPFSRSPPSCLVRGLLAVSGGPSCSRGERSST